ncbi:MAG: hypothetical protein ABN488_14555 [Methylobacteriaceae bacterium]
MKRAAQALATIVIVFLSAAVGFVAGVVLMARSEHPTAPETPPTRWERSI